MEDPRDELEHPMQPIGLDSEGVPRFKGNKIIEYLFQSGKLNLNDIACMPFPQEDYAQITQLLGYSTSGWGDLSTSPPELVSKADGIADDLVSGRSPCTTQSTPLTFGELGIEDQFIAFPHDGDDSGHGGGGDTFIFMKAKGKPNNIFADGECDNAVRVYDGAVSTMPNSMPVIKVL